MIARRFFTLAICWAILASAVLAVLVWRDRAQLSDLREEQALDRHRITLMRTFATEICQTHFRLGRRLDSWIRQSGAPERAELDNALATIWIGRGCIPPNEYKDLREKVTESRDVHQWSPMPDNFDPIRWSLGRMYDALMILRRHERLYDNREFLPFPADEDD